MAGINPKKDMANIRSLKRRIKTSKNIAQTTKAMEMVAASRMKKAQQQALEGRPYSERLSEVTQGLMGKVSVKEGTMLERYFAKKASGEKTVVIVISPDKGLCGGLISSIGKVLTKFLLEEKKPINNFDFITVGKKGRDQVLKLGGNIVGSFDAGMTQPKYETIPSLVLLFNQGFMQKKYGRVMILYTHFINTLSQEPRIIQLLPFLKKDILEETQKKGEGDYLFEPAAENVLSDLIPHYLEIEVYHSRLEAYASEQSARMTAMKNATDNAMDIMSELTMFYNKARQQVITSEIADIATATLSVQGGRN